MVLSTRIKNELYFIPKMSFTENSHKLNCSRFISLKLLARMDPTRTQHPDYLRPFPALPAYANLLT